VLTAGLAASSALCWLAVGAAQPAPSLSAFVAGGIPCALLTTAYALLPAGVLLWSLRRGAPLAAGGAGALGGSAGFLAGYLIMRIACSNDDPAHVATWHGLPVMLGIALCGAVGAWWLARWRGRRG
jgi:hypothetical protein